VRDGYRRSVVMWFAGLMEGKLRQHDDRPGWRGESDHYLLEMLKEELDELACEIQSEGGGTEWDIIMRQVRIQQEAADVANMAMMLADNARDTIGYLSREVGAEGVARSDRFPREESGE
jgi:NTP pyrophosphatase (non-canonical NTP hydrolase)